VVLGVRAFAIWAGNDLEALCKHKADVIEQIGNIECVARPAKSVFDAL
jgi:hypothetical protein